MDDLPDQPQFDHSCLLDYNHYKAVRSVNRVNFFDMYIRTLFIARATASSSLSVATFFCSALLGM